MYHYLLGMLLILLVLVGWTAVQHRGRLLAARHPELGPYREADRCGGGCRGCNAAACASRTEGAP
jgi:hypothetical protein